MLVDPDLIRLRRWRNSTFLVMLIGYIGYYLCRQNLSAAFPLLSDKFGYTNSELGLLALYSELAYATGKFIKHGQNNVIIRDRRRAHFISLFFRTHFGLRR